MKQFLKARHLLFFLPWLGAGQALFLQLGTDRTFTGQLRYKHETRIEYASGSEVYQSVFDALNDTLTKWYYIDTTETLTTVATRRGDTLSVDVRSYEESYYMLYPSKHKTQRPVIPHSPPEVWRNNEHKVILGHSCSKIRYAYPDGTKWEAWVAEDFHYESPFKGDALVFSSPFRKEGLLLEYTKTVPLLEGVQAVVHARIVSITPH